MFFVCVRLWQKMTLPPYLEHEWANLIRGVSALNVCGIFSILSRNPGGYLIAFRDTRKPSLVGVVQSMHALGPSSYMDIASISGGERERERRERRERGRK